MLQKYLKHLKYINIYTHFLGWPWPRGAPPSLTVCYYVRHATDVTVSLPTSERMNFFLSTCLYFRKRENTQRIIRNKQLFQNKISGYCDLIVTLHLFSLYTEPEYFCETCEIHVFSLLFSQKFQPIFLIFEVLMYQQRME